MEPFDDIQCEEMIPEYWEGSPEETPLSEKDLERWSEEMIEQAR